MWWKVPKMWADSECWIIGGGFSMLHQFDVPEEVIHDVMEHKKTPSAYSPYLKPLHDRHVIGINMSYQIGDWIDLMFFGDRSFFGRVKGDLPYFPGLKVTCASSFNQVKKVPGVKYMKRLARKRTYGISTVPGTVCWNLNSGAAAISVAVQAGVKRIILLGFDMKPSEGKRHWHQLYGVAKNKSLPYHNHLKAFPKIAEDAQKLGVEILNASPDSAINDLKKVSVKEVLHD